MKSTPVSAVVRCWMSFDRFHAFRLQFDAHGLGGLTRLFELGRVGYVAGL